jgi:phosphatidylglycerophosphatase A
MDHTKDKLFANICSSFGLGYSPVASGTIGSAPGVLIYIIVAYFVDTAYQNLIFICLLFFFCVLNVLLGKWAETYWKTKDPKFFVLDEYAGYFLTVCLFRVDSILLTAVWTFVMTRIWDILKPPPCRRLEYLPGGWGILADDLVASVYASGTLHVLLMYFPALFSKTH